MRRTRIDNHIEDEPPTRGVPRYNLVSDAVCNTCGRADAFTVTGLPGRDIVVRLACGHDVLWTVI